MAPPIGYSLTPQVAKNIIEALKRGRTERDAAVLAGVNKGAVEYWFRQAAQVNPDKCTPEQRKLWQFWKDCQNAILGYKDRLTGRIETAGEEPRNWQANAYLLSKRFRDEYGDKVTVETRATFDTFLRVLESRLDGETYDKVLSAIEESLRGLAGDGADSPRAALGDGDESRS